MNAVHYSSNKDEWETPPEIFDSLDAEFDFDIDAAANSTNRKCQLWLGPGGLREDGLACDWSELFTNEHEVLHKMRQCKTKHDGVLSAKDGDGFRNELMVQGLPEGDCKKQDAPTQARSDRAREGQAGEVEASAIAQRQDLEKEGVSDLQQQTKTEGGKRGVSVDCSDVGEVQKRLGAKVRLLRNRVEQSGAGSFHSNIPPEFSGDGSVEHGSGLCKLQSPEAELPPNGVAVHGLGHDNSSRIFKPTVWLNCPYSGLKRWIEKSSLESRRGLTVVMLIPARTDTRAWHTYIYDTKRWRFQEGVEVRFLPGRVRFVGGEHCAPFPSCIVIFRPV